MRCKIKEYLKHSSQFLSLVKKVSHFIKWLLLAKVMFRHFQSKVSLILFEFSILEIVKGFAEL